MVGPCLAQLPGRLHVLSKSLSHESETSKLDRRWGIVFRRANILFIGRFVKEEETADTAAGAITFPMMFLAGTFFPLQQMPQFLQDFARILPLYYVNEGLRNSMINLDYGKATYYTLIVFVFACVFFIAGVLLTKWKED